MLWWWTRRPSPPRPGTHSPAPTDRVTSSLPAEADPHLCVRRTDTQNEQRAIPPSLNGHLHKQSKCNSDFRELAQSSA